MHVHPDNRGYGGNQKTCYTLALEADADIVVLLHPDYQYEPKAVPLLIAPILAGEADMTFRSRFAGMVIPWPGDAPLEICGQPHHDRDAERPARNAVHRHAQRHARVHASRVADPAVPRLSGRILPGGNPRFSKHN